MQEQQCPFLTYVSQRNVRIACIIKFKIYFTSKDVGNDMAPLFSVSTKTTLDTCLCETCIPVNGNMLVEMFLFLLDFSCVRIGFAIQSKRVGWGCA